MDFIALTLNWKTARFYYWKIRYVIILGKNNYYFSRLATKPALNNTMNR